jgi:uroporphyrinogen decarboxylase
MAVLNREPVDRLPVDLWHVPEIGEDLRRHYGVEDDLSVYRAMGLDKIVWVFIEYGGLGSQVGAQQASGRTMWGVPLVGADAGAAHYEEFADAPMKDLDQSSLDGYPWWPDPERFDYDDAERRAREAGSEFVVIGPWVSLFEIYCQLRGLEQALIDLVLDPDLVDAILDRVEDIQSRMMRRLLSRAPQCFDLVFVSDDIAGQTGLLMSPASWHRHLEPRLHRWCELIHDHGARVFYHTDGAAEPLVESLLQAGIDVLNPIQHICPGMECAPLKFRYGHRVIFHGGIDNQHVLPFGTPDEVRGETTACLETLGAGGQGYICCSCHNVQAGTPIENILAMVETVQGR